MLVIDTAVLSNKTQCNDFAKVLLNKSGIIRNVFNIIDNVECHISYEYENSNDEDTDRISNTYGGVIYTGFHIVNEGKLTASFNSIFNEDEKLFLIELSNNKDIYMSVIRTDGFRHTWNFVFELNENNSEAFTLDVKVEVDTINKSITSIETDFSIESLAITHCEHKRLENIL